MGTYMDAPNLRVAAANGIDYAYRDVGEGDIPLVLLQHFRGNLDNWDPALVDALASHHRLVTFDNVGVGSTTGRTPSSVEQMGRDAVQFMTAMGFDRVDLLGFSIGSFVAQEVVLTRPTLVRRLVLASSAPAPGCTAGQQTYRSVGGTSPIEGVVVANAIWRRAAPARVAQADFRQEHDRDEPTTWQTRLAQYDAVCEWGIPNHALLQRVGAIDVPVFIANGDSDPMILPHYSYLLAGLIPRAELKIYHDSAHGFLFQHHKQFTADVTAFLNHTDL